MEQDDLAGRTHKIELALSSVINQQKIDLLYKQFTQQIDHPVACAIVKATMALTQEFGIDKVISFHTLTL